MSLETQGKLEKKSGKSQGIWCLWFPLGSPSFSTNANTCWPYYYEKLNIWTRIQDIETSHAHWKDVVLHYDNVANMIVFRWASSSPINIQIIIANLIRWELTLSSSKHSAYTLNLTSFIYHNASNKRPGACLIFLALGAY